MDGDEVEENGFLTADRLPDWPAPRHSLGLGQCAHDVLLSSLRSMDGKYSRQPAYQLATSAVVRVVSLGRDSTSAVGERGEKRRVGDDWHGLSLRPSRQDTLVRSPSSQQCREDSNASDVVLVRPPLGERRQRDHENVRLRRAAQRANDRRRAPTYFGGLQILHRA